MHFVRGDSRLGIQLLQTRHDSKRRTRESRSLRMAYFVITWSLPNEPPSSNPWRMPIQVGPRPLLLAEPVPAGVGSDRPGGRVRGSRLAPGKAQAGNLRSRHREWERCSRKTKRAMAFRVARGVLRTDADAEDVARKRASAHHQSVRRSACASAFSGLAGSPSVLYCARSYFAAVKRRPAREAQWDWKFA